MPWEVACIFSTEETMEPQLINNFAAAAFRAFKDFGTSSEGDWDDTKRRAGGPGGLEGRVPN